MQATGCGRTPGPHRGGSYNSRTTEPPGTVTRIRRAVLVVLFLVAVLAGGGPTAAQEPTTTEPTQSETSGTASERGLASFAVVLALVVGTLIYLRRRKRS